MEMSVTFSCLEKISGINSTPTLSDLAVRKGDGLNLGSSPIERSSAASAPWISDKLRLPSWTLRPSAAEAFSSMVGLNWLTGMKNGATSSTTIKTPTAIRIKRRVRLITAAERWAPQWFQGGNGDDNTGSWMRSGCRWGERA